MTGAQETTESPIGETQFPLDDFRAELADLFQTRAFVTTTDLHDRVGCTRETARVKLNDLVEEGVLETRKVGSSARVWFSDAELAEILTAERPRDVLEGDQQ